MQTYSVLYAADIPHYATFEVQAANTEEAIIAAKVKINTGDVVLQDPDWDLSILQRIIRIEDEKGNTIINDVPLDNYRLKNVSGESPSHYTIGIGNDDSNSAIAILHDGEPVATLITTEGEIEPLVRAGNCHQALIGALKAAGTAIEEATNVMFSGKDGKPVKRLKPADIEHVYLTLCGVMVQVHEAIGAEV